MKKSVKYLYNNCNLCAVHFENVSFQNKLRNRLNESAVPSIFHGKRKLFFEDDDELLNGVNDNDGMLETF